MNYLNNISWTINSPISNLKIINSDHYEEFDEKYVDEEDDYYYSNEVNEIVINRIFSTCGIILKIPIQRFNQNQIDLKLDGPVNVKNILETLYHFYNVEEVNMDILKNIPDDCFHYVRNMKTKVKRGKVMHWIDLMGGKIFFEGFRRIGENTYYLNLGS